MRLTAHFFGGGWKQETAVQEGGQQETGTSKPGDFLLFRCIRLVHGKDLTDDGIHKTIGAFKVEPAPLAV